MLSGIIGVVITLLALASRAEQPKGVVVPAVAVDCPVEGR